MPKDYRKKAKAPSAHELLQALRRNHDLTREMQQHEVPTRKSNKAKVSPKLTKNTPLSFNSEALRGVPGAGRILALSLFEQIHATETGCREATPTQLAKLEHSARNCNTTKSLLTHSYLTGVNQDVNITPKYDPRTGRTW